MLWKEVIGQEEIKQKLRYMVSGNRLAHALLFFGPEGSGILPAAIAFLQYYFCERKSDNESCGQCPSCLKVSKLSHPDIHFFYPIAVSKTLGISKSADCIKIFREAFIKFPYMNLNDWFDELSAENKQPVIPTEDSQDLVQKMALTSFEGRGKAVVIWYPEKMNDSSANKVLKILEEPPDDTVFLLVSEAADQLLPTILSRTQQVFFPPLDNDVIANALQENQKIDGQKAKNIALFVQGNYREALLSTQNSEGHDSWLNHFQQLMRLALRYDALKVNEWVEETAALGREKQKQFLQYALSILRESLLFAYGDTRLVHLKNEELEFIKKFSPFIHFGNAEFIINEISLAQSHIERNAHPKILFTDLSLKLNGLLNIKNTGSTFPSIKS